jgi:hypothetical protein
LPCSFGGRPKLGAHQALATLGEILSGVPAVSYVLEADLKNYFGSLDHGWLCVIWKNESQTHVSLVDFKGSLKMLPRKRNEFCQADILLERVI